MSHTPIFVRPSHAMKLVGISRRTLYRWAKEGHITIHKRGGASFVRVSELEAFITGGK